MASERDESASTPSIYTERIDVSAAAEFTISRHAKAKAAPLRLSISTRRAAYRNTARRHAICDKILRLSTLEYRRGLTPGLRHYRRFILTMMPRRLGGMTVAGRVTYISAVLVIDITIRRISLISILSLTCKYNGLDSFSASEAR